MPEDNNELTFLQEAIRLKQMVRSGWIYSGVPHSDVESVADHTQNVSIITLITCLDEQAKGRTVDIEKALIMATIHDLSESVSQDIDRRVRKFSPEKYDAFKHDMDRNALFSLLTKLPDFSKKKLEMIFLEFQEKITIEAKLVSEADRLDTILQMDSYIRNGLPKEMFQEFLLNFNEELGSFEFDFIKRMAKKVLRRY